MIRKTDLTESRASQQMPFSIKFSNRGDVHMKIIFEKDTPEEKKKKKAQRKAKLKERYGHLANAQEGSLAKFISDRFKKRKESDKTPKKKFTDDSSDFDFLKEGEEADSIQNIKHLKNRLFPKVEQTKHDNHDEKGR